MNTKKTYELTDELLNKYPDISISLDLKYYLAAGYPQALLDKIVELLPEINKTVKNMSAVEAEYLVDQTGLSSMFDDIPGMEDAHATIRYEAYKVAVERNKTKVMTQVMGHWNNLVAAASAPSTSPTI